MGAADTRAPNVCANCKVLNKRCDKSLPRRHVAITIRRPPPAPDIDPSPRPVGPTLACCECRLPSLCGQALRLLESTGLYLDEISVRYFRGIYAFVPVVSRRQFQARLLSFCADPQVDFALLLLCMALLTSVDSPETGGRHVGDQTPYLAIKSLVAQIQALCVPTTRLVQVVVLLAVYEYASGHPGTAFIKIGSSARMAYAARLRPSPSLNGPVPLTDWIAEEEEINIW